MRFISFILVFSLVFQNCISFPAGVIVSEIDEARKERLKVKDCTFKEILIQRVEKYGRYQWRPFIIALALIDVALAIEYYLRVNPVGFDLYLNTLYAGMAIILSVHNLVNNKEKVDIIFSGWEHRFAAECKADYYVIDYANENDLISDKNFIHRLWPNGVSYHSSIEIEKRMKDFLQTNQIIIQIYTDQSRFYRYLYYKGGEKKFNEDFKKYLDMHSN
ncbi:MAG: hypothetical protein SFU98_01375 [Leptospiraceae bacterium]|nr:hypothetical protein [Leptospiraceae bacterium]